MQLLMRKFNISRAEIYGVISFYPQLRIKEPGKFIFKLCYGTACFVKGANIIANKIFEEYHIHPGETDEDKIFTLQTASCLGKLRRRSDGHHRRRHARNHRSGKNF